MTEQTAPETVAPDEIELEELTHEGGAATASTIGTGTCPATIGTYGSH